MSLFQEYALLIAVALPVLVIVAIQVLLFISGERGTLLLPSLKPYDSIVLSEEECGEAVAPAPDIPDHADASGAPATPEWHREAA